MTQHSTVRHLFALLLILGGSLGPLAARAEDVAEGASPPSSNARPRETDAAALAPSEADADPNTDELMDEPRVSPRSPRPRRDPVMEHVRFEGTLGFLGGWARHSDVALAGDLPPIAFDAGAVSGAPMAGLRYDVRLVVAFVRMTVGADLAWSLFRASETTRTIPTPNGDVSLTDRSVFLWSLRFGLGLEATLDDHVRLFGDVTGAVRFLDVATSIDGVSASGSAVTFAPGLRLGARVRIVDSFFVQVSADASPFGPWVAGDVSVGGAIE